ncbi:hypothetical protein [uncultured Clostridium sp.]|uniref:hypothetical protein n=1 Tax=uncultured Clostridium sp. TaxID=59620 RepID=UPI0028E8346C|nr:hypothetical protein [uncultured Clostridium sp.]
MDLLTTGEIESVNLTEWLAVDHEILLGNTLQEINLQAYLEDMLTEIRNFGINKGLKAIRFIGANI